jgi:hypothetical protein
MSIMTIDTGFGNCTVEGHNSPCTVWTVQFPPPKVRFFQNLWQDHFFDKWEAGWAGGIQSMPEIFTKNDIIVFQDLKALDSFVYSLTH